MGLSAHDVSLSFLVKYSAWEFSHDFLSNISDTKQNSIRFWPRDRQFFFMWKNILLQGPCLRKWLYIRKIILAC